MSLNHLPLLSSETSFPFFPMLRAFCCRLSCLLHLPVGSVLFLHLPDVSGQQLLLSLIPLKGEVEPWSSYETHNKKRSSWAWSYEVCTYSLPKIHLSGNKSCSGSHKFFVLATGDICVLFITKIWLMLSAVVEHSWKQDDHFPLTSHVPIGFVSSVGALLCLSCSVSLENLKKPNDSCFPTPKLGKIVESVFVWHAYTSIQKLACFHWQGDLSFSQAS